MARLRTHSHELPVRGQKKLSQRIKRQSLSYRQAAENIAMDKVYRLLGRPISMSSRGCDFRYGDTMQPVPIHTYASLAEQVVSRWLASPKHRASLLSATYQRLGAGVGVDPDGTGLRRPLPGAGLRRLSRRQLLATWVAGAVEVVVADGWRSASSGRPSPAAPSACGSRWRRRSRCADARRA